MCERIARAFDTPLLAGTRQHRVKVSIGAAVYPESGRTGDELLANSHLAFCRAKATKRGSYVIFETAIRQELEARLTLEAELVLASERNEFELFYQPQVRLTDGGVIGAEALIRWRHPVRGLVSPAEFMPVVHTSSISNRIAAWVLDTACRRARIWETGGHPVRVGVNLSPSQFQSTDLATAVAETLATHRADAVAARTRGDRGYSAAGRGEGARYFPENTGRSASASCSTISAPVMRA